VDDHDDDREHECVADLHAHLAATAERPVERRPSRWLGEAQAVAADAVAAAEAGESEALIRRLRQIEELLSSVEATGDTRADEHVREARALVAELLDEREE
jgi:hypothetical protein